MDAAGTMMTNVVAARSPRAAAQGAVLFGGVTAAGIVAMKFARQQLITYNQQPVSTAPSTRTACRAGSPDAHARFSMVHQLAFSIMEPTPRLPGGRRREENAAAAD